MGQRDVWTHWRVFDEQPLGEMALVGPYWELRQGWTVEDAAFQVMENWYREFDQEMSWNKSDILKNILVTVLSMNWEERNDIRPTENSILFHGWSQRALNKELKGKLKDNCEC